MSVVMQSPAPPQSAEGMRPRDERLQLVVTEAWTAAKRVLAVDLQADGGAPLPPWQPGAHVELETPAGLRPYSLCGIRGSARWRVGVLLEEDGRGGSAWLHEHVAVGMSLTATRPTNRFALEPYDEYLLLAGGIGITPLLPMIDALERGGLPWRLVYGARSRQAMAFTERLRRHRDRVTLWPQDERGLLPLDELLAGVGGGGEPGELRDGEGGGRTAVYACGPAPMLDAVQSRCAALALPLHLERFNAPAPAAAAITGAAFEVVLARSGVRLAIPPDRTILDVLEEVGIDAPCSCFSGICGTCETRVLDGVPDHRDAVLSDAERAANDRMCICVSRARSASLTLDL